MRRWGRGLGGAALLAALLLAACSAPAPAARPAPAPSASGGVSRPDGSAAAGTAAPASNAAPGENGHRTRSGPGAPFWAGYVADRKGFFAAEGIDFQFVALQSAFNLTQAVVSGDAQVINFTVLSMATAVAGGAPLKLVASTQDVPTIDLIAQPEINTWADLRGKTVGGGNSPGDYFDVALRMMMAANGLQDSDYVDRTLPSPARLPGHADRSTGGDGRGRPRHGGGAEHGL